jgi:hypothetical protein
MGDYMMHIRTDEHGYVAGYALTGGVEGSVTYEGEIPEGFEESYCAYRFRDGRLVLDEERKISVQAEKLRRQEQAILQEMLYEEIQKRIIELAMAEPNDKMESLIQSLKKSGADVF